MINRQQPESSNPPPDLLGQIADAAGMTPGALLGRPEVVGGPVSDLLALARAGEIEARPTPEYTEAYARWLVDEAEAMADSLEDANLFGIINSQVVQSYCAMGDIEAGIHTAERIGRNLEHDFAIRDIAVELVRQDKLNQAKVLLNAVVEDMQASFKFDILEELAKNPGTLEQSYQLALQLPDNVRLMRAAGILARAGDTRLLDERIKIRALGIPGDESEFSQALIKSGGLERASNWINNRIWSAPDNHYLALCELAGAYAEQGNLVTAGQIAERLPIDGTYNQSYARFNIVIELVVQDRLEEAAQLAHLIVNQYHKEAKSLLAQAYAKRGDLTRADQIAAQYHPAFNFGVMVAAAEGGLLAEAVGRASQIDDLNHRAQAYAQIATIVATRARGTEE